MSEQNFEILADEGDLLEIRYTHPDANLSMDVHVTVPTNPDGTRMTEPGFSTVLASCSPFLRRARAVTPETMRMIEIKADPKKVTL